ncbi:MAG TPA: OmpW family outer membrane protein [Alphaproteobacteria bacterium]|mgnify:CR=1 FL=1|nr:OmpW family outer membrane protein [Alphaproteobacteria bacterium]
MRTDRLILAAALGVALSWSSLSPASAEPWKQQGDWLVRARGLVVAPNEDASIRPIGGNVSINNSFVPELDFTYFMTNNLALELILATTPHDAKALGTSVGDVDLGHVWLIPPTLSLQYHFDPLTELGISPYLGVGINYTIFHREDTPGDVVTDSSFDNSFGYALQAGVDVPLGGNFFLNADVKRLWLDTDASFETTVGHVDADVTIDPWIVGLGVGYKF